MRVVIFLSIMAFCFHPLIVTTVEINDSTQKEWVYKEMGEGMQPTVAIYHASVGCQISVRRMYPYAFRTDMPM